MSNTFIILLSSNQDCLKNIEAAKILLVKNFTGIHFSKNVESKTVVHANEVIPETGGIYLNAVAIGQTTLTLEEIHAFLKNTENILGRIRSSQTKGLVVIDLDLVEWNGLVLRPRDAEQSYYKECLRVM